MKQKNTPPKLIILLLVLCAGSLFAQTPVSSWGQLRIDGPDIVNEHGEAIQLQGMSLFWSQWEGEFYEYNTIKWLRDDWCNNIVRAACGVQDNGYPFEGPDFQLDKARTVMNAAIELDIYALVDWHAHYASRNKEEAKRFFRTIAQEYGHHPNLIYEIFNEPIGYSWWEIKDYAEEIIAEIRKYDPDNIIIVGTPEYAAYPDAVVGNAIDGASIGYTLHYYAASHYQNYRNRANTARANGLCVFVTEYGLSEFTGNGRIDPGSSYDWWNWMKDNNISHCNWSTCDKDEASASLRPGTAPGGFWQESQLTESGRLVRTWLRDNCPTYTPRQVDTIAVPGRVEAENYAVNAGTLKEPTTDEGGGQNIGYTDAGDYLEYFIDAAGTGTYTFAYRVAAKNAANFTVLIDDVEVHSLDINTGDWQTWETQTLSLELSAGVHTLRIQGATGGWNLNYIDITGSGLRDCHGDLDGSARVDNCGVCAGGNTGVTPNDCEIPQGCQPGIAADGVRDDFSMEEAPNLISGAGVYPWGEADLEGDTHPEFQALLRRDAQEGVLTASLSQGEGQYVPFGFGFGGTNAPVTIDLSQDASFEFIFENTSNSDVNVALAIQDVEGNLINTLAAADGEDFADAWMYGITGNVKSGAVYTFRGDFTGGFNADYTLGAFTSACDLSQISTILITVTNADNTGAPAYTPLALTGIELKLREMRLGNCENTKNENGKDCHGVLNGTAFFDLCNICAGGTTGITPDQCLLSNKELKESHQLTLFPNPAQSKVTLSESGEWTLLNAQGTQMAQGTGQEIFVQNLTSGLYYVKTIGLLLPLVKE